MKWFALGAPSFLPVSAASFPTRLDRFGRIRECPARPAGDSEHWNTNLPQHVRQRTKLSREPRSSRCVPVTTRPSLFSQPILTAQHAEGLLTRAASSNSRGRGSHCCWRRLGRSIALPDDDGSAGASPSRTRSGGWARGLPERRPQRRLEKRHPFSERSIPAALCSVSWYSSSGSDWATTPPPTGNVSLPPRRVIVRMRMLLSAVPSNPQ